MSPELDQLVAEVAELTGSPWPAWLEDGAPVLADAPPAAVPGDFYLVGLIGGKDVGKSALVNALVGQEITARTSFGPGTETVIAYAHTSQAAALRAILEREVPGKFTVVEHRVDSLSRQVLLDLPDVDSVWGDHLAVTRRMLRHMLFPVWVQSVEKYADRQPQELLARVAAGNAPGNFVFCINKVDQLGSDDWAVTELRDDYAARLQRVLKLDAPPRVWAIAALRPERYELPALRAMLARQKSEDVVRASRASAVARQHESALAWLTEQDLPGRAARWRRLEEEAQDAVDERLGEPLLDGALPKLLENSSYRQAMIDDCLGKRAAQWPVVNVLHPMFAAVGGFVRRNAEAKARPLTVPTGEAMVDQGLADLGGGKSLAEAVQTTFALLQQSHPPLSDLYRRRKLWEASAATEAAGELREAMVRTVNAQRAEVCSRADRPGGSAGAAVRGLLTVGAIIWFPFVQPIVEAVVRNWTTKEPGQHTSLALLLVQTFSVANVLSTLTFLVIYFGVLWLILRWHSQRRVLRQFARWGRADGADADLNLTARVIEWLGTLLDPIRAARQRTEALAAKVGALRDSTLRSESAGG